MAFIASNSEDLFQIFYPLVPGATQVSGATGFLSGAQDLQNIFRSVADGSPASFDTGFVTGGLDLRYVFAVIGSISTPTPTPTNTGTPTPTNTFTPTPTTTFTPNVTPTPTPTPTVTTTPGVTYTPTPTPVVSCSVNESNIFYGENVTLNSTANDSGTGITPSTHDFEVKSGAGNPPGGSYVFATGFTPSTPTDVRNGVSYTPGAGPGYYQFRAYADYGSYGRIYSPESSVVFAQQNLPPAFECTQIYGLAATRYDANNGMHIGFVVNGTANITISIDPGSSSERTPIVIDGDMVQDFYISGGVRNYNVTVGQGNHTVVVDFRGFDPNIVSVTIQWNSGAKFVNASGRCLRSTDNGFNLVVSGITSGSQWYTRERNCTNGTNNDTGPNTGTSVNVGASDYGTTFISYIEVQGSNSHGAPSLSPTSQTPVDLNACYANSSAWCRDFSPQIYDGRITYSIDEHSMTHFYVDNASLNADSGNKGFVVGSWIDLHANGMSGGSNPHSAIFAHITFGMQRNQAPDYWWDSDQQYSQAGVKAECWFTGAVWVKDRNNPGWGWFFPSNFGGYNYPFHVYSLAWDDWGNNNHSIYLYRENGNRGINSDGANQFLFNSPKIPNFDVNNEILVYGRLPTDLRFWGQCHVRIKSSQYRNMVIWMSPVN
jgi:hypothetical protein